jgi:hypothetical protein
VDEAERKYPRIDAYFIMDHTPAARPPASCPPTPSNA